MRGDRLNQPSAAPGRLPACGRIFFCFPSTRSWSWLNRILVLAFYLSGLALWGWFFNWGDIPFDFHDWSEITAPRLAFLKDAVTRGVLPLHMPEPRALLLITDRFMAVPDVLLSPQVLLLRFMEIGDFAVVNLWLLYSAGFGGLLWLRRRFRLSLVAFAFLFLLFNFNGQIVAHLSIGHLTWCGYFLLPWFVILVYRLLVGDGSWAWVLKMSGFLFLLLLQGSFHQFVWCFGFLALLGVTCWRTLPAVIKAGFASVSLSAVRLFPQALIVQSLGEHEFQGGFPSLDSVWQGLTALRSPGEQIPALFSNRMLGWWELDYYLGLAGVAFVLFFTVASLLPAPFYKVEDRLLRALFRPLLFPLLALLALSYGGVLRIFGETILTRSERVPARLASLAFVFLLIQAVLAFQSWLGEPRRISWVKGVSVLVLLWVGRDLWQHLKAWRVVAAFEVFTPERAPLHLGVAANYPDSAYFIVLQRGLALSFLALIILSALALRERRSRAGEFGTSD